MIETELIMNPYRCFYCKLSRMKRLALSRDFTRFLDENDQEFPHRVEIYIGDKKLVCSGMIIAQQSSVLEQKIRDEHGIVMLDEMVDIGSDNIKCDCFRFLYGAPIEFSMENIETVLKFSSIYMVEDMFVKALKWVKQSINSRSFQLYYTLHKHLCVSYSDKLQEIIIEFIKKNADQCGTEIEELLISNQSIDPHCFIEVLGNYPRNGGILLTKWVSKVENIPIILDMSNDLDFLMLFPEQSKFTAFLGILTQQHESMETMKAALALQQSYFTNYSKQQHLKSTEKPSSSNDVPDDKSETKSSCSKAKSSCSKTTAKGKKGSAKESTDKNTKQQNCDKKEDAKSKNASIDEHKIEMERKIFVGNIPDSVTDKEMEKVFSAYGFVVGVVLVPHRKCAFVEFRSVKASRKILNLVATDKDAIKIMGTVVYIKPFSLQQCSNDNNANPEKKVFVGNLPDDATEQDLKLAFENLGPPKTVTLVSHRKCAFLEYENVKTVRKILNMFANGQKFSVLGTLVYVKPFEVQQV